MTFGLLNLLMLFGLAAVAIPPIIHLLNRRRYTVVDWGAMQFLQISEAKRRRLLIEELLLMLLRMGLIAVMVLALAAPFAISPVFSSMGMRQNRDVVLVFGGSAGMRVTGAHEAAKRWALEFIDKLAPGDTVSILQAKQHVVPVLAEPTANFDLARQAVKELPPPGGGCDWPRAVQEAHQILEKSERPLRNIILLGNGQRAGWADDDSLGAWQALSDLVPRDKDIKPSIWALNFDPKRPANPASWSLAPLRSKRVTAYIKQDIEFQTDLRLHGRTAYQPPEWVRLEVDGDVDSRKNLKFPSKGEFAKSRPAPDSLSTQKQDMLVVPLPPFQQRFKTPGSHLVSVIARPKSGPEVRQDFAVEVLPLPVLIVDGDGKVDGDKRRSDFLRLALDPRKEGSKEPATAILARTVASEDFKPEMLNPPPARKNPEKDPRVLILANVPELSRAQREAVEKFLASGGGVLVTLGDKVNAERYNDALYNKGDGWLPAELVEIKKAGLRRDARPLLPSFSHPALELFRQQAFGGLNDASFPRWWEVTPADKKNKAVVAARLTTKDPFLVEGRIKSGRVLLCTVPLMNSRDNKDVSWDSNLMRLPAFAPLAHELVYYLAGNLSTVEKSDLRVTYNLRLGQPLYYGLDGTEAEGNWTLQTPGDRAKPLRFDPGPRRLDAHRTRKEKPAGARREMVDYADTLHTGVYVLRIPKKEDWMPREIARFFEDAMSSRRQVYYTVQSDDPTEYDLRPWTAADRERVAGLVPMSYETDGGRLIVTLVNEANTQELWWVFMLVVVLLLCGEVWLTRRIVRGR
jgi:hypothetical protein